MDAEATSDHTPVGDTRVIKRPRRSSSSEISTNKRPHSEQNSVARDHGWRATQLFENNVASDQAQVQYGNRYGEVHYHNYQRSDAQVPNQRAGPRSLKEAQTKGEAEEYIARVMGDLSFERMGIRKSAIAPALVNTCQWLLTGREYTTWQSSNHINNHHGFMWIKSKPGAGKSTLMKFLLESTSSQYPDDKAISFFFNARGDADEKSLVGLYRHLLHQLLSSTARLIPFVIDEIRRVASQGWELLPLQNILQTAVLNLESERLTCFIDALDETSEDEIQNLVDFFEELGNVAVARRLSFRVCLSSRHYPHIELERCQYLNLDYQNEHQHDIALYIQSKLKPRRRGASDDILASVQRKAQGVFLWAVLVTQMLKKDYQHGDIHKVRDRLNSLPDDLHNLFHEMIHRNVDSPNDTKNVISTLQWIAFAGRPLTPMELYLAVRSEDPDFHISQIWDLSDKYVKLHISPIASSDEDPAFEIARSRGISDEALGFDTARFWTPQGADFETMRLFILNCSKGLAEVSATVQFVHESVRDYLQETGFETLTLKRGDSLIGFTHNQLKQCCLRWISADLRACIGNWKAEHEIIPFLSYAITYAVQHAEVACIHGVPQDEFIESFPLELWNERGRFVRPPGLDYAAPKSLTEILVYNGARALFVIELQLKQSRLLPSQYESALRFALSHANLTGLATLLENGAPSDSSLVKQDNRMLEILFNHSAILNAEQGRYYHTALLEASSRGREDIVRTLALQNISVPRQPRWYYWTVAENLTVRRHGNAVSALLDKVDGFRIQSRDVYVESLRLAISRGFDEIVQILRDRGVILPEEALSAVDCTPQDAWVNALPGHFLLRESMADLSVLGESAEDEMI